MTLTQFLAVLTQPKMLVTVLDVDDSELIRFYTNGQAQLNATILARTITSIKIESNSSVIVELAETA